MMLLFVAAAILGCILVFIHVAADEQNVIYRRSRYFLAASFFCLAINAGVHGLFQVRYESPQVAVAFNIVTYYLMAILIGLAYIPLINLAGFGRKRLWFLLARWVVVFIALVATNNLTTDVSIRWGANIASSVVFLVDVVILICRFFRIYHAMVHHFQENYVCEIEIFVKCLYKGVVALIGVGVSSVLITYLPADVIIIYAIMAVLLFIYIFISFINYSMHLNKLTGAIADFSEDLKMNVIEELPSEEIVTEAPAECPQPTTLDFSPQIEKWIEERGFCSTDVSINNLAAEFGTNRQYLYVYFKDVRKTNFRLFVNTLRIEYAKQLLSTGGGKSIAEVADLVGFKAVSHFSVVFKDITGKTPSQWRDA